MVNIFGFATKMPALPYPSIPHSPIGPNPHITGRLAERPARLQMPHPFQKRLPPPARQGYVRSVAQGNDAVDAVAAQVLQVDEVRFVRGKKTVRTKQFAKLADVVGTDDCIARGEHSGEALHAFAADDLFGFQEFQAVDSRDADQTGGMSLHTG